MVQFLNRFFTQNERRETDYPEHSTIKLCGVEKTKKLNSRKHHLELTFCLASILRITIHPKNLFFNYLERKNHSTNSEAKFMISRQKMSKFREFEGKVMLL